MTELDLNALFLGWVVSYGSPMVGGVLFLGALGIPVPGTLIVVATGAFIRQGIMDIYTALFFGMAGSVSGDTVVFSMGRFAHHWIRLRFGQTNTWQKAQSSFDRQGGMAIYLTRWLLTPFALPTTLIAGSSNYPWRNFTLFVILGQATWITLYGGVGYAFGSQWELVSEFVSNFTGLIVGLIILGVGVYLLFRRRKTH